MLKLEITSNRHDRHHDSSISQLRQSVLTAVAQRVVSAIVRRQPVDTGRSRRAWASALEAVSTQATPTSSDVRLSKRQARQHTQLDVEIAVPYLPFVEYGTTFQAPVAMVRTSLAEEARS